MDAKQMFIDIIEISEVIVSNDYQKLYTSNKRDEEHNLSVKPMINKPNLNTVNQIEVF